MIQLRKILLQLYASLVGQCSHTRSPPDGIYNMKCGLCYWTSTLITVSGRTCCGTVQAFRTCRRDLEQRRITGSPLNAEIGARPPAIRTAKLTYLFEFTRLERQSRGGIAYILDTMKRLLSQNCKLSFSYSNRSQQLAWKQRNSASQERRRCQFFGLH